MKSNRIIIKDFKDYLNRNLNGSVKDVILFGSKASGKSTKDSDFDVLIVLYQNPGKSERKRISDLCYDLELKYDIIADTHIISESEINTLRGKQPIFQNAFRNGIYA